MQDHDRTRPEVAERNQGLESSIMASEYFRAVGLGNAEEEQPFQDSDLLMVLCLKGLPETPPVEAGAELEEVRGRSCLLTSTVAFMPCIAAVTVSMTAQ